MKTKFLILLSVLSLFLTSCLDLEETYTINNDGSYVVNYNMDMSKLMGMMKAMMPDSVLKKQKNADTVIYMSSAPDSIKRKLDAKELQLLNQTLVRTKMNLTDGVFKIGFENKGNSPEDLRFFLTDFGKTFHKMQATDLFMPKTPGMSSPGEKSIGEKNDLPFDNKKYDYVITNNSFQRKIRPEVIAAELEKDKKSALMLKSMDMKMMNTTIINLPRPATSVDNPNATLSADKKQVKLVINLVEAMEHPEMMNFKVNY